MTIMPISRAMRRFTIHQWVYDATAMPLRPCIAFCFLAALLSACATTGAPVSSQAQKTETTAAPAQSPAMAPSSATAPAPDYLQVAVPTINSDDPLRFTFATPINYPTPPNWRPPVIDVPLSHRPEDHFWLARPIASNAVNWPLPWYRYGSTDSGRANVHAGIDIDAPQGTSVLAAGPGEVVWSGWGLFYLTPGREDDPYGIAAAIKHDFGYANQPLYTTYGHMEALNNLYVGQRVSTGDVLGWVGNTGNSTGPHLDFGVRVGRLGYYDSRNPELWIAPYAGWGILAGQVLDKRGRPIPDIPIVIYDARNRLVATVYTYSLRVANPDDEWHENFAISDLPEGEYWLKVTLGPETGEVIADRVTVTAGHTNFVVVQAGRGFIADALPAPSKTPPYPTNAPTDTSTPTATPSPTPTRAPRSTPSRP